MNNEILFNSQEENTPAGNTIYTPMNAKLLFNPAGKDDLENRSIIYGNTTNLFNLNNIKYPWATDLYRQMTQQFWLPEKTDILKDIKDYPALTDDEKNAYKKSLSFLVFLASLQVNTTPNLSNYITSPEINIILSIQMYQETITLESLFYLINHILPKEEANTINEYWKTDTIHYERIMEIISAYQNFKHNPDEYSFRKTILSNYFLKGLYLHNAFILLYTLASRNQLPGSAKIIQNIHKDILTHITLYRSIIAQLNKEYPKFLKTEEILFVLHKAVNSEIKWNKHIARNILGINPTSMEDYTKYRANLLLQGLNMKPVYPDNKINPYSHLEKNIGIEEETLQANEGATPVENPKNSITVTGWEDF